MSPLLVPMVLVFLAASPAFAWLGEKTWYEGTQPGQPGYQFRSPIQAEWLFPTSGPARVMWMFMAQPGRLEMRVWARDRDYWTATDLSNHAYLTGQPRAGYEEDTLTYTWVAERGTIEGSGPSVAYVARDKNTGGNLTPGADTVTVTIDDVASLPPGDCGSRNDSPPFESQLSIVVDNPGGPFRIVRILVSGTTGAPATSGYNQQSDPNQRAYAIFSIGFATSIRATSDFGTGTGYGTVSLLIPRDETHEMHTVTVRVPPNGSVLDEKQANFGLFFHHCCHGTGWPYPYFDEVDGAGWNSPPNWFEGFAGPPDENMHWHTLVGAGGTDAFIYKQNMLYYIGAHDWDNYYGNGHGKLYIGELLQDDLSTPGENEITHFWVGQESWWQKSDLGGGDVIYYDGIDIAGNTVLHERRHKILWHEPGNWGGYYDSQIGPPGARWPYNRNSGYDYDADGVKNDYEWAHDPPDGAYNWLDAYSLNRAHNGQQQCDDAEFDAVWWGERPWEIGSKWPQDWSDHGYQNNRH